MPIDPWGRFNEGLQGMQNTMMSLAALKRQESQDARATSLQDLQMKAAQQGVDETNAKRTALIDTYGTNGQADPYSRALGFQAQEAKMQEEQKLKAEQQKQQMEKSKFAMDLFTKTADAVGKDVMTPEDANTYYRTHMKLNGIDYSDKGVDITFKKHGGYFSGPLAPDALVMMDGKAVPYGGQGVVEKARIAGMDPQTGKPIFQFDEHTTFKEPQKPEETWGTPYESKVGGKKAMVQKSSRGKISPVIQDTSTTVVVKPGSNTAGPGDAEFWGRAIQEGRAALSDVPARGAIKTDVMKWMEKNGGSDYAGLKAENSAYSSSLTQQQKQLGSMGSFVKNLNAQIDRVGQIGAELYTADTRLFNMPIRALRGQIAGSPMQSKYDMYITEIENEIGKLSTGSTGSVAELSVGAQQKWAKIHDKNLSVKDMLEILKETKHAGDLRVKSVRDQINDTRNDRKNRTGGRGGQSSPKADPLGIL